MKVLVINSGSSSIKYQMIDMDGEKCLAKGMVSRIGLSDAVVAHKPHDRPEIKYSAEVLDHQMAFEHVIAVLLSPNHGVIKDPKEIDAVGHRTVHGGEDFTKSCLITDEVVQTIRRLVELAPLHNPPNIRGIIAARQILPHAPQVACFDTAFHHRMPPHAFIYGIPYVLYKRHKIRRYGFHGMSHRYVSARAMELLGDDKAKVITCHLGNGASISAVDGGVSIDTSMGYTPLEGVMMGTRSGDLDPAIPMLVMSHEELSLHEVNTMLNKHSGLQGICGLADLRDVIAHAASGEELAELALSVYCYRIRKYIGAFAAALGGLDALVFTAGVGENSAVVRERCTRGLDFLGVKLDAAANEAAVGATADISAPDARVKTFAIPTNEELVIARDTLEIVGAMKTEEARVA